MAGSQQLFGVIQLEQALQDLLVWGSFPARPLTKRVRRIQWWVGGKAGSGGQMKQEQGANGMWSSGQPPHPHLKLQTLMGPQGRAPQPRADPQL